MTSKRIFIDIDGVLADFKEGYSRVGGFSDSEGGLHHFKEADDIVLNPTSRFWETLNPLKSFNDQARFAILRLERYHHITFITNRLWIGGDYMDVYEQTLAWLKRFFYFQINLIVLHINMPKATIIRDLTYANTAYAVLLDDSEEQIARTYRCGFKGYLYPEDVSSICEFADIMLQDLHYDPLLEKSLVQ